jgi:hypothetical protein
MTRDDAAALEQLLAGLPRSDSDGSRFERVRSRCHDVLARGRQRVVRSESRAVRIGRVLESVMVCGFCLIYLSAVVVLALRSQGML